MTVHQAEFDLGTCCCLHLPCSAHLMPLDDERHEGVVEGKMRRGALPAVFGKAQQRRCDKDKDEMEALRRRVVTESRPLHKGRK